MMLLTRHKKRSDGTPYISDALTGASGLSGKLANACLLALGVGASTVEVAVDAGIAIEAASLGSLLGQKNTAQKVPTIRTAATA
ncbi:hypothetical protein K9B33_18705 [Sphingobium sp. 3R8]|uniref:hypothetical protein n=1 Tax=Sphingobium sp. 3R8 TaxID=2874921 RepID=UPI001CCAFA71|nr:hypothetical protein [Sphingobium sp. 3R8]MBZ9649571.1 hypothetical protein [Sphingobium sp. 3R8]